MSGQTSRRGFLKSSVVLTAGAFGAPYVISAESKREKVKMAVIGAGGQGGAGMGTARGENLVAVCDVDAKRAGKGLDEAKKQNPDLKVYTDYRKLFDEVKGLEAVWVATPDHNHFPASIRALEAGAGVYCEKPLTHSLWEARKLREVAAKKKLATQMGNQGHSSDTIRLICEYIWSGVLGDVTKLHCVSNRSFGASKRPESKPVPEGLDWQSWIGPAPFRDYHDGLHPFSWRGWLDFGTASLGDMACHTIDGAVWALKLGEAETIEVVAEEGATNAEGFSGHARIVYRFPARGKLPPVEMTWWNGGGKHLPPRPECLEPDRRQLAEGTYYYGTKGMMESGSHCGGTRLIPETFQKEHKKPEPMIPRVPGHSADWLRAIKDPSAPAPCSNFGYSARLTEIVLLGVVAQRCPGEKLVYDMAKGRFTNSEKANGFVKRAPRKGWEFGYEV
ncbi:MAG TPA: Gfo/Idh/MocA family oxidoreductase [Planctomycetota bacterium]|nr:Gfo/Idh/MocA family oxidoreductase [Planctomycetota bacterium]HRR81838.1 Gfo/Idh/MocA family oxidoreductase [Planctomycetota bacterium]